MIAARRKAAILVAVLAVAIIILSVALSQPRSSSRGSDDSSSSDGNLRSNPNISVPLIYGGTAKSISLSLVNDGGNWVRVHQCPTEGAWPTIVLEEGHSAIYLSRAPERFMCGLSYIEGQGQDRTIVQIARSYWQHDWEITAGRYAGKLPAVDCTRDPRFCRVSLGSGKTLEELRAQTFQLVYSQATAYNRRERIARFLERTTFGVTMEEIKEIEQQVLANKASGFGLNYNFAQWVKNQTENIPIMSHRAIFRKRMNGRLMETTHAIGDIRHPCEAGARFRREAFSALDFKKTLEIKRFGAQNKKALYVDGQLRTVVDGKFYSWLSRGNEGRIRQVDWPPGNYSICKIERHNNGNFVFEAKHPNKQNRCIPLLVKAPSGNKYYPIPPVSWTPADLALLGESFQTVEIPDDAARRIDGAWHDYAARNDNRFDQPEMAEIILKTQLSEYIEDPICMGSGLSWIATFKGNQYLHDGRPQMQNNIVTSPFPDGGGGQVSKDSKAKCINAPRTFQNEDYCIMSNAPDVCSYRKFRYAKKGPKYAFFNVTPENIMAINDATQADDSVSDTQLYAIEGLDVTYEPPPCTPGTKSTWIRAPCSPASIDTLGTGGDPMTAQFFLRNINDERDNSYLVQISHSDADTSRCHPVDVNRLDFEVRDPETNQCWKFVHPDHLKVFDFADFISQHPGGSDAILAPAQAGNATLVFPYWHEMSRWSGNKNKLKYAKMKLGDRKNFFTLRGELRTDAVAYALGISDLVDAANAEVDLAPTADQLQNNVMVCGSPGEVANNPFLGGSYGRGAFSVGGRDIDFDDKMGTQRETAWFIAVLNDPGQFRQRAAWALSQILAVTPTELMGRARSENYLNYYDIFVRHAFGNYRDVLKEVSYSAIMGDMLSYVGQHSTAYSLQESGVVLYADENYAREIMQLFTTGLVKLNHNGTEAYENGSTLRVYTNDDIEEYARAWTGFQRRGNRGNVEAAQNFKNSIDPMKIVPEQRDPFPKMGLDTTYIGDGYPLCSDLPAKHFLRKGATYRVLGGIATPEKQEDPPEWNAPGALRLSLVPLSRLYQSLCSPDENGACAFKNKVVLDETLSCYGEECLIDSVRSLEVDGVFYEYVRPPCVHRAFYNDGVTIVDRADGGDAMCADPWTESASVACCDTLDGASSFWLEQYFGERTLLSTANLRCNQMLCTPQRRPSCDGSEHSRCLGNNHIWTPESCQVKAKVDRETGRVGIVHFPWGVDEDDIASVIQPHQPTYFRVDIEGDRAGDLKNCNALEACSLTEEDKCLCDVTVSESQVFVGSTAPSKEEVLSLLHVGSFEPEEPAQWSDDEVRLYRTDEFGALTRESVFEVVDDHGIRQLRRNVKLLVQVTGTNIVFRNPVHFMSLADPEVRDAEYETEATLDHYFQHPNTAPFLAIRFAQRFGISNPSPRYISTIATAFTTGTFSRQYGTNLDMEVSFGSGTYGDLAAAFAAVVLDREAVGTLLDVDPTHGSLKEPVIKLVSLLRTFKFEPDGPFTWADFGVDAGAKLGQWPHRMPSVFSYFLPEFSPRGRIGQGSLVAPEAQVLTGPRIIDTMNGIYSLLKYGLTSCGDGFGKKGNDDCDKLNFGAKGKGSGSLTYQPESTGENVVDELATLMTAGRLSQETRDMVKQVFSGTTWNQVLKAQMLIASTPEFHSTGVVRAKTVARRTKPAPTPSTKPYKALVYVFLEGGMDSFNMLAPHTCTQVNAKGKTLREQYDAERRNIGLTRKERTRIIDAANQPCSQFAVHPKLPLLERLYNAGELSFFANVGYMEAALTRENYNSVTGVQLFAHNIMQNECQKIDPKSKSPGTGFLGRLNDKLLAKGFNAQPLTIEQETSATEGNGASPLVSPILGVKKIAPREPGEGFDASSYLSKLNNATQLRGSIFGEAWSGKLLGAVDDANMMSDAMSNLALTQRYSDDMFGNKKYARTAKAMAQVLLTHQHRGSERDVIFVPLGQWDFHAQVKPKCEQEFNLLNGVLEVFEKELKGQGLWEQVTVVIGSEFGRTVTPNSNEGSDHGYGGHYFLFGGSVDGGKIHGEYPSDITESSPLNIGRGRLLPTSSWESVLTSVAQWMGVDTEEELDYILPNRAATGTRMFQKEEVFKS